VIGTLCCILCCEGVAWESGIVLGGIVGVGTLATEAVWVRDGGSIAGAAGTFGLRCRCLLAGGGAVEVGTGGGVASTAEAHCIESLAMFIISPLLAFDNEAFSAVCRELC
jgi:hypothetical protein